MARLGLKSKMIAAVGDDGFGDYIFERFSEVGVDVSNINRIKKKPTSVIFVSRTKGTQILYLLEKQILVFPKEQIPKSLLENSKIYHTTCLRLVVNQHRQQF